MNDVNPITILFMFAGRCLAPLLLMLGVSYILRRLGLIKEPPPPGVEASAGDITHD